MLEDCFWLLAKEENAEIWKSWVDVGLQKSNELNNRRLGASSKADLLLEEEEDSEGYPEDNENQFDKTSKIVNFS